MGPPPNIHPSTSCFATPARIGLVAKAQTFLDMKASEVLEIQASIVKPSQSFGNVTVEVTDDTDSTFTDGEGGGVELPAEGEQEFLLIGTTKLGGFTASGGTLNMTVPTWLGDNMKVYAFTIKGMTTFEEDVLYTFNIVHTKSSNGKTYAKGEYVGEEVAVYDAEIPMETEAERKKRLKKEAKDKVNG